MSISSYIMQYFLNKDRDSVLGTDNMLTFNYMENGFFTSIDFIEMIADIEQAFSITFEDQHLQSPHFCSIGGLINIVEKLSMENQCVE